MPHRRLRTLALALVSAVVVSTLSVYASPAARALDAPTNPSPSGAQTGIPTFSWDRVAGATTYDFQISTSESFSSTLVNATTVQRQYVPTKELPTGTQLYWRVRATGAGEVWTTTAFSRNVVGPPNVVGPADGADLTQPDQPVVFAWQPVPGADSYQVQYGTDPNFVDQTTTKTVEASSYVMPLQPVGTYYWHVRGVLADGVFTAYSPGRSYIVKGLANDTGVPPAYPPDDPNFAIDDVVLDWAPIKGAKSYQIQISTDQLFPPNTIVDSQNVVYGTRYSPAKTLGNDQYFWRIRATDAGGFQPDWASRPIWHFKRAWSDQASLGSGYPLVLGGGGGSLTVGDPFYYQWAPVKHASHYEVQLSTSASFSSFTSCTTVHTTLVYGDGGVCWPAALGNYYWRVVAYDEFSNAVPHTDAISAPVGRFSYDPGVLTTTQSGTVFSHPDDPTLSGKQPVLRWSPMANAERYRLTITGPTNRTVTTSALSYSPRDLAPGNYRWDVRTIDHEGAIGAGRIPSSQPSFTISPYPLIEDPSHPGQFIPLPVPDPLPATGAPTPNPANVGSSYRFPTLKWDPVTWVDHYTLYVRPVGAPGWNQLPDEYHYAAGEDTRSTFLDPGDYEWKVEAVRLDDTVIPGGTGTFTILQLPDVDVTSYRAAITGNALTGNAGTTVDTCNAGLPATCQNLRQTPVLGWDSPDPEVGYYKLVLSRDAELTNQIETKPIASTMYLDKDAIPDSQAGSAYFWLVVPCTAEGHCSPLTHATHAFNKLSRPQTLVSPAPGVEVQNDVTLTWDDYLDSQSVVDGADPDQSTPLDTPGQIEAEYYRVQTASDQNFTQNVVTNNVDQRTFTSFSDTYPEGTTWWRVQAVDESGNQLAWSTPRSFVKKSPVPQLDLPADGASVPGDFTLSWTAQPYAASYDIEVYKNGDTGANTVNRVVNANTVQIKYVLDNLDPTQGPYAWRVRRRDGKDRPGDWSPFRLFSVTSPGVSLTAPLDGAAVEPSDQLFQWEAVQGATTYKFERRPGTTGNATETVNTPTTKWAPIQSIAGGSWQWRVTAYDTAGHLLADSTWLHPFTVVDTPVATVPVSITGSGVVDSTITLNPAQWNMPNNVLDITYQWFRGTSAVAGATGVTYDVTAADIGKAITVKATATRQGYKTGTSTSNAITGTQAGAPVATVPVTIDGTGFQGSTLTLSPPTWDLPGVTTTYQWFRGTSSVSGQTGTTYVVGPSDIGKEITVKATATKPGYATGLSVSNAITGALNPAPVATTPVSLTGTGEVGSVITMTPPVWDTADVTVTYQWFRDTSAFTNNATTYTIASGDVGKTITVKATAAKAGYVSGVSTSNGILATQAAAVLPTTLPSISGVPAAKETLTASPGVWPTGSGQKFAYQWFVNGEAVAKETSSKYVVRARDAGLPVSVRVTMTMNGFAPSVASSAALSVAKLSSKVDATVAKKKITQRQRGVLTVKVTLLDFGVPLGQVQVKDGSKVIASPGLQTGKNGVLTIRLKKLKVGKHKLTITYLGSVSTLASSDKVTIKVVKGKKKK
ncbi:Ig-like domain repeat protein [Nocardioides halotolerans]|uniref:Ig-like domain repeat protein n=1 Tax=Nocardioides halotolerans TaxID=433660 RepID=UPI0003FC78C0|nr:Ig-like domain repeat protein [Nocardioides halotolerans]